MPGSEYYDEDKRNMGRAIDEHEDAMEIKKDTFDFGFSSMSEKDIIDLPPIVTEKKLLQQTASRESDRAAEIYQAVLPLLNNLAKDADKNPYIHWPNRAKKIEEFRAKLEGILYGN